MFIGSDIFLHCKTITQSDTSGLLALMDVTEGLGLMFFNHCTVPILMKPPFVWLLFGTSSTQGLRELSRWGPAVHRHSVICKRCLFLSLFQAVLVLMLSLCFGGSLLCYSSSYNGALTCVPNGWCDHLFTALLVDKADPPDYLPP